MSNRINSEPASQAAAIEKPTINRSKRAIDVLKRVTPGSARRVISRLSKILNRNGGHSSAMRELANMQTGQESGLDSPSEAAGQRDKAYTDLPQVEITSGSDSKAETEEADLLPTPDLVPRYRERIRGIGERLDRILEKAPDAIQFGPTYSVQMSDGSTQEVMTLYYDIPGKTNKATGKSDRYRRFDIIALDVNGYPIADRYTTVHYMDIQGKKYAKASGMIATGIREVGLTAPIELAHMDIMQREANKLEGYDQGLKLRIFNANLERLQELEESYYATQDANLLPQIEVQRAEQKRWQSVYGPKGWLGFNTSQERVFTPDHQGERLETSRGVNITRVGGKPMVQSTSPLSLEDQTANREVQLAKLRTMIGKIKTITTR